jgi:hypothetical protein
MFWRSQLPISQSAPTDTSYRDHAHKLQKAIAEANGLSVAADLVEESLGVRGKAPKERQKNAL